MCLIEQIQLLTIINPINIKEFSTWKDRTVLLVTDFRPPGDSWSNPSPPPAHPNIHLLHPVRQQGRERERVAYLSRVQSRGLAVGSRRNWNSLES